MHMLLARSAMVRGMQLVAGMLSHTKQDAPIESDTISGFQLVSWTSGARSRREDELARFHQMQTDR